MATKYDEILDRLREMDKEYQRINGPQAITTPAVRGALRTAEPDEDNDPDNILDPRD